MESLGLIAHKVLWAFAHPVRLRLEQVALGCHVDNGEEGQKGGRG